MRKIDLFSSLCDDMSYVTGKHTKCASSIFSDQTQPHQKCCGKTLPECGGFYKLISKLKAEIFIGTDISKLIFEFIRTAGITFVQDIVSILSFVLYSW